MLPAKLKGLLAIGVVGALTVQAALAVYIPTAHDTKLPPETITYPITTPSDAALLTTLGDLSFYFKDDRDVLIVVDERNGYTWKSGLDIGYNRDLEDACDLVPDNEKINCTPLEDRLNTTYTGIANSLVTIEYYDASKSIKRLSSASYEDVRSTLGMVNNDPTHYRLEIDFEDIDLQLNVHIHLDEQGYTLSIRDEEITGPGQSVLAAVQLSPFLGASGGQLLYWDPIERDFERQVAKPMVDGYVLVPDGPGALIRFVDRNVGLTPYIGNVYGNDPAENAYYYTNDNAFFPFKDPLMPLYGIAHGNRQAAFVAYATQGAAHMTLLVSPEEDITYYTYAYPRFEFNQLFHQVYNKRGDGYFTLMKERRHYDIEMRYAFLANDGEYPADYVGMAKTYRDYLIDNDKLQATANSAADHIGIRLDFVMADIKQSILGTEDVVVSTAEGVGKILEDLNAAGIYNVSSGLLGWQSGGITSGHPGEVKWSNAIGSKGAFTKLIDEAKSYGYDVSFSQDYVRIHRDQVNFATGAARHINTWYIETRLWGEYPVNLFGSAKPKKSAAWITTQTNALAKLGVASFTIDGIGDTLSSDYDEGFTSIEETMALYVKTLSELDPAIKVAMNSPHDYLWGNTDIFLDTPVYATQFLIETDTVPFLQLVLQDSMTLYAPYSNFSFYTQKDVLRMIDFNLYPSFALTEKPAYLLALTNANRFYSTEYTEYKSLIDRIYHDVDDVLSQVIGTRWVDRTVIENGVILNTYADGTRILINYTDEAITFEGSIIRAQSADVLGD